ncbi:bifunctional RecB family nuclease/DEAD/DEAH box helicase [Arthrobacter sp. Bz4]|uniref:TM0106 family RecB-like putative nuclease n=1 Tax=Arthrobacter sp. Bz4 TaxID=2171979 RepID=UPI000D50B396|nr:bifunctional RecB family nuclease/DEAD/DEAH box helicase [Arthrobacter sp. Bz4]PVE19150.1 nuclease [Arthrobacter sp. Bz4]
MFLLDPTVPGALPDLVFSATDLVTAAECEYRLLSVLDEKLGRSTKPEFDVDAMLERTAVLGDVHERKVLDALVAEHGPWNPAAGTGVYDVVPAAGMERALLETKHRESIAALRSGADVVFQAAFFDGQFHGRSDFLVKTAESSYAVWDTKLARHAKVSALLQLAAYGDQLLAAGIPTAPEVTLVLGNGAHSVHSLLDILPVFRERRDRFLRLIDTHRSQPEPVLWGSPTHSSCGRCNYCQLKVAETRDLLLVGGMSTTRRAKLHEINIRTIDQLAAMEVPATDKSLLRLRDQARMQTNTAHPDGSVEYTGKDGVPTTLSYRVLPDHTLATLPAPSQGDIFFDFEGDPLWQDSAGRWGLEYLFGVVENPDRAGDPPPFLPLWAHSRVEERHAFTDFLEYVARRRALYPDLHIYHYASYEKTALRNLSLAHVVGEDAVDTLLREGVLVDLYETVRHSLRISEHSYSIKKLEPLYMGEHLRSGDVTDAGASVVAYADYCTARDSGNDALAAEILAGIRDYNEYDCLSTLRLRNWLLDRAAERGIAAPPAPRADLPGELAEPSPEETRLLDYLEGIPATRPLTDDEQAVAMVAAAVGYHRREDKQFWWEHFDRLDRAVEDWADTRNVFVVQRAEVLTDWEKPTPRSNPVRTLRLSGVAAEGSDFEPGKSLFRMYDQPLPDDLAAEDAGTSLRAGWFGTEVIRRDHDGVRDVLEVREKLRKNGAEYSQVPVALTPDQPIATKTIRAALSELAHQVGSALPGLPPSPGLEVLRRANPTLSGLRALPVVVDGDYVTAITEAVTALDNSYLAVQGPPGTGKTYVGSHVIAALVARGWKVGVVGQSHKVVEHLIRRALAAGVPAERTAKKTKDPHAPWSHATDDGVATLLGSPGGALVGGTAWTMTGSKVPPGSLDLLVIDEAGQYSLANTLAVSRAASRLLLLGDPQQLPQVTQGTHPEPVDTSALGWLSAGHATLSPELGYFLADSWRLHPDVCAAVSRLSYDGKLESAPAATQRFLDGPPAGVECIAVAHTGRTTSSPEEAGEVVLQVHRHLGLSWTGGAAELPRPLEPEDILVVAAYNAQVQLIQDHLAAAGLSGVRVGTVDRFQGQEAPVVLVSMACSAAAEAPRGIGFLLNRNRINVAVSRGQWRAVVIRSPELTHHLPSRPEQLEELGAFIGLCTARTGVLL